MRPADIQSSNPNLRGPQGVRDQRIRKSVEVLSRSELGQVICLDQLAASLNLSGSRFRHLFKNEVGVSPQRYVRILRLRRARNLLEESFLRVKEVMHMVGYSNPSHFVRDYKNFFSATPSITRTCAWLAREPHSTAGAAKAGNK